MLVVVALRGKYSSSLYLNALLWVPILMLLGFACPARIVKAPATAEIDDVKTPSTAPSSKSPPAMVRLYDVHDMIDRWAASPYDHGIVPNRTNQIGNSGPVGAAPAAPPTLPAVPDPLMDAMVSLISDTIHAEEWLAQGGSTATISYANRTLIIGGSPAIHHDVEHLLRAMREADANWPLEKSK